MSEDPQRLQELLAALVRHRISESLAEVEEALASWRRGECDVLDAHGEIRRHTGRIHGLTMRVSRAVTDGPDTLLRDALDAGLLDADEFRHLTGKSPADVERPPPLDEETRLPDAPDKRVVFTKLLDGGPVLIHVDPRPEGVDLPPTHREAPRLILRFGYQLTPPILDIRIDETGVGGTLVFSKQPYRCFIPWSAVFAVVGEDGRGLIWTSEVPAEVAHEYNKKPVDKPEPPEPEPNKPRRAHLKLV